MSDWKFYLYLLLYCIFVNAVVCGLCGANIFGGFFAGMCAIVPITTRRAG